MNTWFEAKIKYMKTSQDGHTSKVSEGYLVDAITYTEAEASIVKNMQTVISGEYVLSTLKKSNISEIVWSDDEMDDRWYKSKVVILDVDAISGKEKSVPKYFLVAAHNIEGALEHLKENLSTFSVDCEIFSISDTNIMDVYRYEAEI